MYTKLILQKSDQQKKSFKKLFNNACWKNDAFKWTQS